VSRHCDPPNGGEAKGSNCEPCEIIADRVGCHCGEIAKDGLMFKV